MATPTHSRSSSGVWGFPATPPRLRELLPSAIFGSSGGDYTDSTEWQLGQRVAYSDGSSIDWSHEYAKERQRKLLLAERRGAAGLLARLWDSTVPWLVIALTGLATGTLAASLDVLTEWLSDIRTGKCADAWWMNRAVCCTGLDPGEICRSWKPWPELVASNIVVRSVGSYLIYVSLALLFATVSSYFVQTYAPFAFHTGIPEIKTILGGYVIRDYLNSWTLLIKSLGLPLAVASGLSLGKEGPLVHVACCIGNCVLQPFSVFRGNEARQREVLSAAAAAGVSVAFGAPLGGVIFSLEEISTFFPGSTLWQSFVCAIIAAVTLQYIDPYNTGKLVLFQVTTSQVWRGFELVPWLLLGVMGGVWGALFIRINEAWERLRRQSGLHQWPVTEVAALAVFTAVVSYLVNLSRMPAAELVENLFQDCDDSEDIYGICEPSSTMSLIIVLLVTAFAKTLLTAVTFGASIPAGIFLPTLVIGACMGRAVGLVMQAIQRAYPLASIFASCPPDGSCISPPVYAVIGAASALAGVTRMTISLVVIMFELTGAVDLVLQIMVAVMIAKFTADSFSKDGIYEMWIHLRAYPFLNNKVEYRRDDVFACDVMTPAEDMAVLVDEGWSIRRIERLLEEESYRGFPIVRSGKDNVLLGYISRNELQFALETARGVDLVPADTPCHFVGRARGRQLTSYRGHMAPRSCSDSSPAVSRQRPGHTRGKTSHGSDAKIPPIKETRESEEDDDDAQTWLDLKPWVDQAPITMDCDTPMELAAQMLGRLGLRYIILTKRGRLAGILTKQDLHLHVHPSDVNRRRARAT